MDLLVPEVQVVPLELEEMLVNQDLEVPLDKGDQQEKEGQQDLEELKAHRVQQGNLGLLELQAPQVPLVV